MRRIIRWQAVLVALLAAMGVLAGVALATQGGGPEVRISGIRHEDGRVEVALQQRVAGGEWGERIAPTRRIIPADSTGRWLNSSPIAVTVPQPEAGAPASAESEIFCVIHHGQDGDVFWGNFTQYLTLVAADVGLSGIELHAKPDIEDQAAAVEDCTARGALGVAVTLPSVEALQEPLAAARAAGVYVITFNSGAQYASRVGSLVHYGLDERGAGARAGERFNAAGVERPVLCVVHEAGNSGLDDRCAGLSSTLEADVVRVDLSPGALADLEFTGTEIAAAVAEHDAGGVLVLNGGLAPVATGAAGDALVGSIGRTAEAIPLIASQALLFMISDGDVIQATQVLQDFVLLNESPITRALLTTAAGADPRNVNTTSVLLQRPAVFDHAYYAQLFPGWETLANCMIEAGTDDAAAAQCLEDN